MKAESFFGRCADGKLPVSVRQEIADHIAATFDEGQQIEVVIKKAQNVRSTKANAYYWSTVLPLLAAENEQTPEEVHDAMCVLFLTDEQKRVQFFNKMTGEMLSVDVDPRRSSKLNGEPFYKFVERVRLWGVEFLGVITPDPDPDYWRKRGAVPAAEETSDVTATR